ncbi:hypothetical protein HDU92_008488 [Lobulomyces angularis]|nr:hypothetical protein HDU92_008488 [Lobulomyces angularis]
MSSIIGYNYYSNEAVICQYDKALEFLISNKSEMFKHSLKEIHIRKVMPDIQFFFLLKEYRYEDDKFWSKILSSLDKNFNINSSAGDDRYWKNSGGPRWGYELVELLHRYIESLNFGSNNIRISTADVMSIIKKEYNNDSFTLTPSAEITSISSNYDAENNVNVTKKKRTKKDKAIQNVYKNITFDKTSFFKDVSNILSCKTKFNTDDEYFGKVKDTELSFNNLHYIEKIVEVNKDIEDPDYLEKMVAVTKIVQNNHGLLKFNEEIIDALSSYVEKHIVLLNMKEHPENINHSLVPKKEVRNKKSNDQIVDSDIIDQDMIINDEMNDDEIEID